MNTRGRRAFAPEVIFTAATVAALFPFVLWSRGYKLPIGDRLDLTFIPAVVWGCGLASFLLGARFARRTFRSGTLFRLRRENVPVTLLLAIGIGAILVQVYFAVQDVYG